MEGYEVVTSDEEKLGHVVGIEGDLVIVEHGTLRKTKNAIPMTFAHTDDNEQIVRVTVSKDIVETSPKIENGSVDKEAIAEHYGLVSGTGSAETEGEGETARNDRLIAVAAESRLHRKVRSLGNLNETLLDEIEHFFVSYNQVKGKEFKPLGRFGPVRARKVVEEGVTRFKKSKKKSTPSKSGKRKRSRG